MKTLIVLRHGKSSWKDPGLDDVDRPLKKRGKRAVARMAVEILEQRILPDLVLCSAARRARQTFERFRDEIGYEGPVEFERRLYFTGPVEHLAVLAGADDRFERVLLIGHNPDLEELVERLTGQPVEMPTAGLAVIDLDVPSWSRAGRERQAELRFLLRPKELP